MVSKPKKRQVRKVRSETPEQPKSHPQQDKPQSPEVLIRINGELIEQLFQSKAWTEIAFPLLAESIAGVSGRLTNGRYYHGTLTRDWSGNNSLFVAGYQKALMDFNNNLHDFIVAKDKLLLDKATEKAQEQAPVYNPFMEDSNEE
jgi:hypothetical protein